MEYYYPYFRGTDISTKEDVIVEKHAGKESYAGACDDVRIGVTLIFYLQNAGEYLNEKEKGFFGNQSTSVTLSGLAMEGKNSSSHSERFPARLKKTNVPPSTETGWWLQPEMVMKKLWKA